MKHKHADLIHAWADGQTIQYRQHFHGGEFTEWADDIYPDWNVEYFEFRIKTEKKKPVVRWLWASFCHLNKAWKCGEQFYSDNEMNKVGLVKLEWSRTEFPE